MNPLVPLRTPLDAAERRRTARHLLLDGFGPAAQARLASARVLVVGAGGLGSPVLQYLAASGVGTLGIVDDDIVSASNLQRQVLHGAHDVGALKTTSATAALRRLRPGLDVVEHTVRLDRGNAEQLLAGYDLVVDACDSFATRYAIADAATALGMPVVWGTVLGWDGQVSIWWSAAPDGRAITYRDVFGDEPGAGESCETAGVLSPACGVVGATLAVEAIKLITGTGDPALGRLLSYDARTSTWEEIPLSAPPNSAAPLSRTPSDSRETPVRTAPPVAAGAAPSARAATGGAVPPPDSPDQSAPPLPTPPVRKALVVDVGLAPVAADAVWVRLEDLAAGTFPPVLADHPADLPIVVVCEQGLRSRGAAAVLRADGWKHVTATTYAAISADAPSHAPAASREDIVRHG